MTNYVENKKEMDFTAGELVRLLNSMRGVATVRKRVEVLDKLAEKYHIARRFNLYQIMLSSFYGRIHLGKTQIKVKEDIAQAILIIDVLSKHEHSSKDAIPEDHAKYFFALIKEFIIVVENRVMKQDEQLDFKNLLNQLVMLKDIVGRAKNNEDITTRFDYVIQKIKEKNVLLIDTKETTDDVDILGLKARDKKLELSSPLYKLTKSTFIEVLSNVYSYKEEDFYKIIEHALFKFDKSIFKVAGISLLPLYLLIMTQRYTKKINWYGFNPEALGYLLNEEELKNVSFYPSKMKNWVDFYNEYERFLDKQDHLNDIEKEYLSYIFLRKLSTSDEGVAKLYIDKTKDVLSDILKKLSGINTTKELYENKYEYSSFEKLLFSKEGIKFGINIIDGKVTSKYETSYSFRKLEGKNEESVNFSEFELYSDLYEHIVKDLKNKPLSVEEKVVKNLNADIDWVLTKYKQVEINYMPINKKNSDYFWAELPNKFLKNLIKEKMLSKQMSDTEWAFLVDYYKEYREKRLFESVNPEVLFEYIDMSIKNGQLNPYYLKELADIYLMSNSRFDSRYEFIYSILSKVFPERVEFISNIVFEDDEMEERTKKQRAGNLVYNYFLTELAAKKFINKIDMAIF